MAKRKWIAVRFLFLNFSNLLVPLKEKTAEEVCGLRVLNLYFLFLSIGIYRKSILPFDRIWFCKF
jgi:hypothetical protein